MPDNEKQPSEDKKQQVRDQLRGQWLLMRDGKWHLADFEKPPEGAKVGVWNPDDPWDAGAGVGIWVLRCTGQPEKPRNGPFAVSGHPVDPVKTCEACLKQMENPQS